MNTLLKEEDWIADEYDEYDDDSDQTESEVDQPLDSEQYLFYNSNNDALKNKFLLEIEKILWKHSEVNCVNALALNKVMQEKLTMVRSNLESLLEGIKTKYGENEDKLRKGLTRQRNGIGMRGAYLKGSTFYFKGNMFFKDANCRNCPNNPDYTYRSEVEGEVFPMDFELRGRHVWSIADKVAIVQGIKEQVIDYLDHRNRNSNKIKNSIEKQISVHTEKLGNLLEKVDEDFKIDWTLISVHNLKHRHSAFSANAMWNVYLKPSLKRDSWKAEENNRLLEAVTKFKYEDWQSIAAYVGNRSDYQCFIQFYNTKEGFLNKTITRWTKAEDKRLLDLVNTYTMNGVTNWNAVASRFPNRTKLRCISRYLYSVDPKISHDPFTPEEDLTLLAAVEEYGENFGCIPRTLFPNRSSAQLRGRYKNTLINRHKINLWSTEDDKKLMNFVAEHGPSSWIKCAEMLGNHTRTSCRTRYLTIQKFLQKNPDASIENIPSKLRGADNLITTDNWTQKIAELRNNPDICLKSKNRLRNRLRTPTELKILNNEHSSKDRALRTDHNKRTKAHKSGSTYAQRLRAIELRMYKYFKCAYNFKLGLDPCTKPLTKPQSLILVQSACRFQVSQHNQLIQDKSLPSNIAKSAEIILTKGIECLPDRDLLYGYRLPPSWATLMGFRALCVQSAEALPMELNTVSKIENVEDVQTFRQRLRVLFYKTGLLSRLNPQNIENLKTKYTPQVTTLLDFCSKSDQMNPAKDFVDFISKSKTVKDIKKGKWRKRTYDDAINLKTVNVSDDSQSHKELHGRVKMKK